MGVKGLWKAIGGEGSTKIELHAFKSQRVAVDAVWQFALAFVLEHHGDNPRDTQTFSPTRCLLYEEAWRSIEQRLSLLQQAGIEPIFVFDGAPLKAKEEENRRRRESAAVSAVAAVRLHEAGEAGRAQHAARRALHVPRGFCFFAQKKLRGLRLMFVVAPYEADAQIARLVADGIAAAALTEDGDLVAYGCRQVLSKLKPDGSVVLTDLKKFFRSSRLLHERKWSLEAFQIACCLSGCDYHSQGVAGIGFTKAARLLARHGPDVQAILGALASSGKPVADECRQRIRVSLLTYRHQTVFSLFGEGQIEAVPLTKPPTPLDGYTQQMLGPLLSASVAAGVCGGFLHPMTVSPLEPDWPWTGGAPETPSLCPSAPMQWPANEAAASTAASPEKNEPKCHKGGRAHHRCQPTPQKQQPGVFPKGTEIGHRAGEEKTRLNKENNLLFWKKRAFFRCTAENETRNGCLRTPSRRHIHGPRLATRRSPSFCHKETGGKVNASNDLCSWRETHVLVQASTAKPTCSKGDKRLSGKRGTEKEFLVSNADQKLKETGEDEQPELISLCPCKMRLLLSATCMCKPLQSSTEKDGEMVETRGNLAALAEEDNMTDFNGGHLSFSAQEDYMEARAIDEQEDEEVILLHDESTHQEIEILPSVQHKQNIPLADSGLRVKRISNKSFSSKRPRLMFHGSQDSLAPLFFEGKPLNLHASAFGK